MKRCLNIQFHETESKLHVYNKGYLFKIVYENNLSFL
jgi:hypothetical protein